MLSVEKKSITYIPNKKKSNCIIINKNTNKNKTSSNSSFFNEYGLKSNQFYPNNSSPNRFVIKLENRLKKYFENKSNHITHL